MASDVLRPFAEALAEAEGFISNARDLWRPHKTFVLFSGGDDSLVLLDLAKKNDWAPDGVVHVNTGTGVPETTQFVRDTCRGWGLTLHELHPPKSFEDLFIRQPICDGLPGPGMHRIAYSRLKERAVRTFTTQQKGSYRGKVALLTGVRHDESVKRMGYTKTIIDRDRCRVWVNPIYYFTKAEMSTYRSVHGLPENPVSANLHISGECLCGCFARPDELEEIRFFYPTVAARIEEWQAEAAAKGLTYSTWGQRRKTTKKDEGGRLCVACVGRQLDLDETSTHSHNHHTTKGDRMSFDTLGIDPTRIDINFDPLAERISGIAQHGPTPFDCPLITPITEDLWTGGCVGGVKLPEEITDVVSLWPWQQYKVDHKLKSYFHVRLYDSADEVDRSKILRIAEWVNEARKTGIVLVHCQAGLNRSALIAGTALVLDGMTPAGAIKLLRDRRSPAVLCNKTFEGFVRGLPLKEGM